MVHDLHLVLQLCKTEPVYNSLAAAGVAVLSETHDIANARLTFPGGCVANITASRISAKKMRKLRLFQKNAYFSIDMDSKTFEYYSIDSSATNQKPVHRHEERFNANDPLSEELQSFIFEIVHNKQVPATRGDEALTTLRMSDAILHTIEKDNAHTIDS
jgi:predicted dehydrogenase